MKKNTTKSQDKKVKRPWGGYEIVEKKNDYWVKKLYVAENGRTSLQSHAHREEVWVVLRGKIRAVHGNKETMLTVGDMLCVPQGEKHRLCGVTDAIVLEAAFGKPREGDITRYDDDYGRVL